MIDWLIDWLIGDILLMPGDIWQQITLYWTQARSLDQKRLWCQHLKQLILDNYSAAIPEKAKELVMTLGKSREEGEQDF